MNRKGRSRCIIVGQDCLEKKRVIQRQKERKKKERVKERRERTKGIMKRSNPREIPSTITILSHIKQSWTQFS